VHFNVTAHSTAEWTGQQLREAFPFEQVPRYLLRDRDGIFGSEFRKVVKAMGIKEVLSAPRSPWQRAYVERVIGTIRRECLDHMIVLNEASLYRHVKSFLAYYHEPRTHLSLAKDPPAPARSLARTRRRGCHTWDRGVLLALPALQLPAASSPSAIAVPGCARSAKRSPPLWLRPKPYRGLDHGLSSSAAWPWNGRGVPLLLRLPASLFAIALTGQRLLDTEFLAGLQIKGVSFDFADDVLLNNLPLEAAESVFNRLAVLEPYLSQVAPPIIDRPMRFSVTGRHDLADGIIWYLPASAPCWLALSFPSVPCRA
jgi:hypothetical protein